jgi:hypothetical protein
MYRLRRVNATYATIVRFECAESINVRIFYYLG